MPNCRATQPWVDQGASPDKAMVAGFRKLTALHHANPILRRAEPFAPLFVNGNLVVTARRLNPQWLSMAAS